MFRCRAQKICSGLNEHLQEQKWLGIIELPLGGHQMECRAEIQTPNRELAPARTLEFQTSAPILALTAFLIAAIQWLVQRSCQTRTGGRTEKRTDGWSLHLEA
jgi:hypothetical protein